MKKILWVVVFAFFICSCSIFKAKYGCPTNGKNIGAERLLSGDKKTMKAVKRAKKFRA
jgi:hypothetical protein